MKADLPHEVSFITVHRDGQQFTGEQATMRPPSAWTADDAKQALWELIRQLEPHGVYRVDVIERTALRLPRG